MKRCYRTWFKFSFLAFFGIVLMGAGPEQSIRGIGLTWIDCQSNCPPEGLLPSDRLKLAMHQGRSHGGLHERHQMHHGMGRGGQGICPQTRTAPKAPDEFVKMKNPLKLTVENLTRGEDLYQWSAEPSACKTCHGATGNGFGMMAQGLAAMPRNFTCSQTMHPIADGQLFWIIQNGTPTGMPGYKFLSDQQIWELVLYLRQLSEK